MTFRLGTAAILTSTLIALGGCASGGTGYDPGASSLPMGESCQNIRSQLNALDAKGVPALVERQGSGGKLSGPQKAQADQYNRLLSQYLGARCHV